MYLASFIETSKSKSKFQNIMRKSNWLQ